MIYKIKKKLPAVDVIKNLIYHLLQKKCQFGSKLLLKEKFLLITNKT